MGELTEQSKNRLRAGDIVTQELICNDADRRRWIAIYPLVHDTVRRRYEGFKFKVIDFELLTSLIESNFSEENKENLKEYLASSEIELIRLLNHLGVDCSKFESPWKNEYPL